ncbi:MAG: hypothetical protein IKC93_07855 [Candidatus Methanomethylophilaceae archaeon]|nr:hypothetical protein [Candidatus Methanomethylophilaceae archaeon]
MMMRDTGVGLVDEYAELQERIDALKRRLSDLEKRRDAVSERIVSYADSNGFISLKGHGCSALVRHEKRVELPEDKGPITDALHSHGLYDRYSMPNWARIRAEIAKGTMHHDIADMAEVSGNPKVYFKRETGGRK